MKIVAVGFVYAGCFGALHGRDLVARRRSAYLIAGPALGIVWIAGILLAFELRRSLLETWVLGAFLTSLVTLNGVLYAAGKEERNGVVSWVVVFLSLLLTTGLMVYRPL